MLTQHGIPEHLTQSALKYVNIYETSGTSRNGFYSTWAEMGVAAQLAQFKTMETREAEHKMRMAKKKRDQALVTNKEV